MQDDAPGACAQLRPITPARRFGTFWAGRLSALEQACLASFAAQDHEITLFSYDPIDHVPEGVRVADAAEILPRPATKAFLYHGRPHLGHFSDYFRYRMMKLADLIWVDADMVLLRDFSDANLPRHLFAREAAGTINGAIFYTPDQGILDILLAETEKLMHKDLAWGETGPVLIQNVLKRAGLEQEAADHSVFYPIHHDVIGRVLLPQYRGWCEAECEHAVTLHLFNNVIERMGYWKDMAPPVGSFLHAEFKKHDALRFFSSAIPEAVMTHQVNNFRWAQTGEQIGVKSILRQLVPAVMRSARHHRRTPSKT